jgi:hypothetical protein
MFEMLLARVFAITSGYEDVGDLDGCAMIR